MNISIVVPNRSDMRMKRMIQSIDYFDTPEHRVEILIILNNETPEIARMAREIMEKNKKRFQIRIVKIKYSNFGVIYNTGIKESKYDNVMFIDTDIMCEKGSVKKVVDNMENNPEIMIVKAKLVYKGMDNLVERARFVNTTDVREPYIPIILIKKQLFFKLKDDYMFPVDTVWCADADFAYRALNENIKIAYNDAIFYHDRISVKKDLKDALMYGFGKGIRIKRTKEYWNPFSEMYVRYKSGKENKLSFAENGYSMLWLFLQQITCMLQLFIPKVFKDSLPFEMSESIKNVKLECKENY